MTTKYFLLLSVIFLFGCATSMGGEEIARLQYGLARMHKQTKGSLEKIEKREQALGKKVAVLEEKVQDLKTRVDSHQETLVKIQPEAFENKEWVLTQEKDNQLFQAAYNDYLRGQYSLAIMGFKEYLRLNPKNSRAVEAQYWLAESCFSQEDYKSAVEEFDRVIKDYPESRWLSPALYKKAVAMAKEGGASEALVIVEEIIEKFPKSDEGRLARELKKELESQIPKSQ